MNANAFKRETMPTLASSHAHQPKLELMSATTCMVLPIAVPHVECQPPRNSSPPTRQGNRIMGTPFFANGLFPLAANHLSL